MQKQVSFAINNNIEIKKETISGVLLSMLPLQADGTTVCAIGDLNKVSLDVILERAGQEPKYLVQGYLEDILIGMYSQTTKFELNKAQRSDGYKFVIDFSPARIVLQGEDILRVSLKAENTAFTSLHNGNSSIHVESIPAFGGQTLVPVLREFPVGNGETIIDKEVGNQVVKATLVTDLTADYLSSTKSKPTSVDIFANGYEKSVSEDLVVAENIHYLDNNPESDVQDLVLYTGEPLDAVRIKCKLDKPADASAKLMVIQLQSI